ncbi:MAG: hypothetical protein H6791_00845 [Candidatus Nomurabacteria bacterium]|nr:MAG: hypothetical protein H6791_00845 [Candidatus Nomurabacteria bacterium]
MQKKGNKKEVTFDKYTFFDIGSGSVAMGVGITPEDTSSAVKPKFEYSHRERISLTNDISFERFLEELDKTIKRLNTGNKAVSSSVKDIHVFLSPPWYASQVKDIRIEKPKKFLVTKKLIQNTIEQEAEKVEKFYKDKYKEFGSESIILERKILKILANGYNVENPIGKEVSSIVLKLYFSVSPKSIVDTITNSIRSATGRHNQIFHSTGFSNYKAISVINENDNNYLTCDIGAELTEISIVTDDSISASATFPIGGEAFLSKLRTDNRKDEQIFQTIKMIEEGSISEEEKNKFLAEIKEVEDSWEKDLTRALHDIAIAGYVPSNIYLFARKDMLSIFKNLIQKEPAFIGNNPSIKKINSFDSKYLSQFFDMNGQKSLDASLAICLIYLINYNR